MDSNPVIKDEKKIYDLTDISSETDNGNGQEVIIIDGRGYENNSPVKEEIFNLVDVIDDPKAQENLYKEILKRSEEIVERIARQMVPEIAEKLIKAEIEKIKKGTDAAE